jgi:hypothetical protein
MSTKQQNGGEKIIKRPFVILSSLGTCSLLRHGKDEWVWWAVFSLKLEWNAKQGFINIKAILHFG